MRYLKVALALGFLLGAETAVSTTLTITPVRIVLPASGQPGVVKLTNQSDNSTLIQLEVFDWTDVLNSAAVQPSRDVIAVPPVFDLEPKSTQIIRIALRKPIELHRERSYRLIVTEVPEAVGPLPNAISFALKMSLPLFVAPQGATPKPDWSLRQADSGPPELVLANEGNAHVRVGALKLLSASRTDPLLTLEGTVYVLAGQERSWPLDLTPSLLDGPLTVKAETNLGTLEALVALEGN